MKNPQDMIEMSDLTHDGKAINSNAFSEVPDEVLLRIFSYTDPMTLASLATVNRRFYSVSQDARLVQLFANGVNFINLKKTLIIACQNYLDTTNFSFFSTHGEAGRIRASKIIDFVSIANDYGLLLLTLALFTFKSGVKIKTDPQIKKHVFNHILERQDTIFNSRLLYTLKKVESNPLKRIEMVIWKFLLNKLSLHQKDIVIKLLEQALFIFKYELNGEGYASLSRYVTECKLLLQQISKEVLSNPSSNMAALIINSYRTIQAEIEQSFQSDTNIYPGGFL